MAVAALMDIDVGAVEDVVGHRSFQRGRQCARKHRVMRLDWDGREEILAGSVLGDGGIYQTEAYFASDGIGAFDFLEGECSCPVGPSPSAG